MRKVWLGLLVTGAVVGGLVVAAAAIPGFPPRAVVAPVMDAFGGVRCNDERCPPDAAWVPPVDAPVTSGFRTAERPDHHGVDMAAEPGTPVVAASAGVVTVVDCQASLHGEPYSCDQDGTWEVRGCGWYVKVHHADYFATLYCHLLTAPEVSVGDTVATGDVLGYVGSSGNSSAPHLHFELQQGSLFNPPRSATALDPEPFFSARDAPLT